MLTLSQRDRDRLAVLRQVEDGLIGAKRGAELLGMGHASSAAYGAGGSVIARSPLGSRCCGEARLQWLACHA